MSVHAAPTDIALGADFALIVVVATLIGFLAHKTKQPTIVAYILTGIVLGPVMLDILRILVEVDAIRGVVGGDVPELFETYLAVTDEGLVGLMAELGLGFLLFLLGMKMRFEDIREILRPVTNIAIGQTVLQTALAFVVAWWLGFDSLEVAVIALATVFGATPVIVKILTDKDEIKTVPGKIDVGVLIVQDIYLVVVLALFSANNLGDAGEVATTLVVIFVMMAFIGLFAIASSLYVLPEIFRRIADNKNVFLVVAIAWAFLFIAVAERFELSVEVGAFLAGLSLAQLPYSKELEDRITPITDFFILVFFASIGLQIEGLDSLLAFWQEAIIASVVLMIGNFWIMFYLIDREGFGVETSFIGSINMVQVSEFSLVVGALAFERGFIGSDILGYLSLMALMTMGVSTYIITYNDRIYRLVRPFFRRFGPEKDEVDIRGYEGHAVAVGYDGLTRHALPMLKREFGEVVVIDRNPEHIEELEDEGEYDYVFGDARRDEVRKAVNLKDADFVLSSSVEPDINRLLLMEVKDGLVFVEAGNVEDARILYDEGADYVVMNKNLTGEMMGSLIHDYFEDTEAFEDRVRDETERIRRATGDGLPETAGVDKEVRRDG